MNQISRLAFLIGLLVCLCLASTGLAQDATVVRRAAFDIGSGVIKCTIADVDITTGHIVKRIKTLSEKVDFAEDLARSYDSNLSPKIMARGITVLKKFKSVAEQNSTQQYSAVGGKVFHIAQNGRAYFVAIKDETGIPARVISEQQSAMLSYHAANQELHSASRDLLVWDIGAGGMAMTMRCQDGGLLFYLDPMSSISFKNVVISSIQKKDIATTTTPNPVHAGDVAMALSFIQSHAAMTVPPVIISRLHQSNLLVAGVGGVHFYSIPEVLGGDKRVYTRDEVAKALQEWTNKPDEAFNSQFADTRLTNLILVLGYMDALGIKEVYPLKINHSDGLFAAREFW